MNNILLNPEFLRLAMKTQENASKTTHLGGDEHTKTLFGILDMLDMLDVEFKKEQND